MNAYVTLCCVFQIPAVCGLLMPILRNCRLLRQTSAIAVKVKPAPANNAVNEITLSNAPATAADTGPKPMKVNSSTLMVRPIIS